ncbi:MAG: TonB-dependent receptor [Pseudomonadota bacterium]
MRGQSFFKGSVCAMALALGMAPVAAIAQDTEAGELVGEDIVIYGTKVESGFLQTPTSVGVITDEQIEDQVVKDTFEGFNLLANVRRLNTNGGNDSFQIRGFGADGVAGIANPATAITLVIDGAAQNSEGLRRGARSTWDLEQIEVLRGPQSGLYGRAALAGAVVLKSKDPTYDFEGAARAGFGSNANFGGSIMANAPLIEDQLAIRFSADVQSEETDITISSPLNDFFKDDDFHNARVKVLAEPDFLPGFSALLTFNHAFDQTANPSVSQNLGAGITFSDRIFNDLGFASEVRETTVNNYIADLSLDVSDDLTVRSITAYVDTDLKIDGVQGSPFFSRDDLRDGSDISQELALEIEDSGHGLSGLIGAFYGVIEQTTDTDLRADLGIAAGGAPNGFLTALQVGTSSTKTTSFALYADLTYNFYGPFSVLGGLRYQRDKVRQTGSLSGFSLDTFMPFVSNTDIEAEFNVYLPHGGLMYEIDDTQTITATARRGYRAGFTETSGGVQNDIDPEFVWAYELAYRYDDGEGLSVGANAFYNDYSDQQFIRTTPGFGTATQNAASSNSYGFEVEGRYAMDNGLSVFGSLGYLKTEIDSIPFDPATSPCGAANPTCAGNEFPEAPSITAAIGGTYQHEEGFFASADVNYTGSYFSNGDLGNTPSREIDGFFLVNASVGYEVENFRAQVFVQNLLNNDYLTSVNAANTSGAVGDSRTVGASLTVDF